MARRRNEVTLDRTPRLPPAASMEDVAQRARNEALLARVSIVLLLPVVVAAAASLFHDLDFALFARSLARDEGTIDPARILALDARASTMVLLPFVASIPFTVAFLIWLHRCVSGAHWAGGGRWMKFSPTGAVVSFFIPFRNLVLPFQALHELSRASDPVDVELPPRAADDAAGYRDPALAPVEEPRRFGRPPLAIWWATWIAAHVVGFIGARASHSIDLDVAQAGGWLLMGSDALEIVAAVSVGLVVHRLTLRRIELFRRLGALTVPSVPDLERGAADG